MTDRARSTDTPPAAEFGPFTVVVVPEVRDTPGRQRVKRWLKAGLRQYGLTCKLIRYPTRHELLADGEHVDDDPE